LHPSRTLTVIVLLLALGSGVALWAWPPAPPEPVATSQAPAKEAPERLSGSFTLAVSWQPAFCETRPGREECRTQTSDRHDARNFALHGLWPEPASSIYCGVEDRIEQADRAGRWDDLPAPDLSAGTRAALRTAMPGARSMLDRHEWIKHGTCAGVSAETYYARSIALMAALNASPLRDLFAAAIGGRLTAGRINAAMEEGFGPGARGKLAIDCTEDGERRLILELRIRLEGEIGPEPDLAALLAAAPEAGRGCAAGTVDPVGLQ